VKKSVKIAIIVLAAVAVALGAIILLQKESKAPSLTKQDTPADIKPSAENNIEPAPETSRLSKGRYTNYSAENVANQGYSQTIVFFYAPWCPECRAFKKAITENSIPDGVQILETDFDSSTDLKKKYGVTQQTTFVRVNSAGELQKKWPGYGKDKSIDLVLEGVK
jgi:thiol-disulfide isomerase/thioredoxin